LDSEKRSRELSIKEKLKEESRQKTESLEQEYKYIFEEAEIAFAEEKWEKAKSLFLKLIQQGKFDVNYMRYNVAICNLKMLTNYNPEIINHINNLVNLLNKSGESEKSQMITEMLEERLNTFKQKDLSSKNERNPWWKELF
jgi:hypothetical protein